MTDFKRVRGVHRMSAFWVICLVVSLLTLPGAGAQEAAKPDSLPANSATASQDQEAAKGGESAVEKPVRSERRVTPREKPPAKKQLRWLALSGSYEDLVSPASLDPTSLLLGGTPGKSKSFYRLCEYLEEMEGEENLSYLLFDLSDPNLSLNAAQLDELCRRLSKFKSKGKKTIAWLEDASGVHLAIASQCDEILLADFGGVDMPSSSLDTMFYREAMDLVGVKASVVRAGDFKGAVEPYMNPSMSEHLREHYLKMLSSINAAQVSRIAKGRGLTNATVRDLQKKRMLLPSDALAAGLVTKLAPYGSMKKTIQDMIGSEIEWTKPKSKPKQEMSFFELMGKLMSPPKEPSNKLKEDSIVVLHLQGTIVDGKEASSGSIVAGPTVKLIEELTQDDKVKGVVARINSPGGSASASEGIRQAFLELAKKKPVVYSMGEVAASGGYWITCIGQPIYAEQGTITGSIGVFSMKLSVGSLLRRVGVHIESVNLDPSAALNSIDRAWTDDDISNMQRFIDEVYGKFLRYASESRKMPLEKLQSLAGGRVWSGQQAKEAGLVDEIGGVDDCLQVVAKKANLSKFKVAHKPEPSSGFDLLKMFEEGNDVDVSHAAISEIEKQWSSTLGKLGFRLEGLKAILRHSGMERPNRPLIWAMMSEEIRIK